MYVLKWLWNYVTKTYHQLYNLNLIGLRFYSVWTTWKTDMAYKFLTAIKDGTMFQNMEMEHQSYTYIDDIVNVVVTSLDNKKGIKCGYIIWK